MRTEGLPPPVQLMRFIVGVWISKPIYAAAELGIADMLADGPKSIDDLARESGTHAPYLYRMMRALASVGIFEEIESKRFQLTPMAGFLKRGAMRSMALLFNSDWSDRSWGCFLQSVKTGETAFEIAHGMPVAEWLGANPQAAEVFNEANAVKAAGSHRAIVESYDFSSIHTLVDIGGGVGALMGEILLANPSMKGIVAEVPAVIPEALKTIEARGLGGRCRVVECDFFEGIPPGYDAYLMSNILHDWPDERCRVILENCRRAMQDSSKLLIVEMMIPRGNEPSVAKLLDLEMLVTTGGRERTEEEFRNLLLSSRLELSRIVPLGNDLHVIEAMTAR